jgi:hypothetical protein
VKARLPSILPRRTEPRPPEGELIENPRPSRSARVDIEARREYQDRTRPQPEADRPPEGTLTTFEHPADAAPIPIPAAQTDYPPEGIPHPVELSELAREAIERQRASEAPSEPPRVDTGEPTPVALPPEAASQSLGYSPDDRTDGEITYIRAGRSPRA